MRKGENPSLVLDGAEGEGRELNERILPKGVQHGAVSTTAPG